MGSLYETIVSLCERKNISGYRMCKDIGIQPSIMTDLKSERKKGLSAETAQKIADYFQVSVGYLLGREEPTKKDAPESAIDLSEIEFALMGEVRELDEEDIAELLRDAQRLRELKELRKKQREGK